MISTIVLMGTLVTLLIVQDGQKTVMGRKHIRQKVKATIEQRNGKMMLTILGCAVAVGLVANVVKKTMNGGTENEKTRKKVKLCGLLGIVCWLQPAWSGPLPGTDEMYPGDCREINRK